MSVKRFTRSGFLVLPFTLFFAVTASDCDRLDLLPPGVLVDSVSLDPDSAKIGVGTAFQFNVVAYLSDSSTAVVDGAVWTATGGTVSTSGMYTAGNAGGIYEVIASDSTGDHADTSRVIVLNILGMGVVPESVSLDTVQSYPFFNAYVLQDLSLAPVPTTNWTATGGVINADGRYLSARVPGVFMVIGNDGSGRIDTAKVVITPGSAQVSGEPSFTAGQDTSLLGARDGTFDSYTTSQNITSGGWQFSGSVISPGRGGSGKAARLTYQPAGVGVEPIQYLATAWSRRTHVVIKFWFRTSVGADPTSGRFNSSGFKWLVVNRDANAGDPNGRITGGVHSLQQGFQYGNPDNGVQFTMNDQSVTTGGFWQHLSKQVGWSVTNGSGTTQRQQPVNDGNWHRYTLEVDPTQDILRVWVDGILIISSDGLSYAMNNQGWDQVGWGQNVVPDLLAGWGFTLDYDDIEVFTRP